MQESNIEQSEPITYTPQLPIELICPEFKYLAQTIICPLCKGVIYQATIDICGHTFCKECLEKHFKHSNQCPVTKKQLSSTNMSNCFAVADVIKLLRVVCCNKNKGCNWEGSINDLFSHIENDCAKEPIKCKNEGCCCKVIREDSEAHEKECEYRTTKCPNCGSEMKLKELPAHQDICPKLQLECPNKCGVMLTRETLDIHLKNECNNEMIFCPYKVSCGYQYSFPRKDLIQHLNKFDHLKHCYVQMTRILNVLTEKNILTPDNSIESEMIKSEPIRDNLNSSLLHQKKKRENEENKQSVRSSKSSKQDRIKRKMKRRKVDDIIEEEEEETPINKNLNISLDSDKNSEDKLSTPEYLTPTKEVTKTYHQVPKVSEIFKLGSEFRVSQKSVKMLSKKRDTHVLVIGNLEFGYEKKQYTEFQVTCFHKPGRLWLGVGLCDPARVEQNKYIFMSDEDNFDSGLFGISTNGYTWNGNNPKENNINKHSTNPPRFKPIQVTITFQFLPIKQILNYKINDKISGTLTKVKAYQSDCLTPFIAFLNEGDEVQFNYFK